MKTTQGHLTSQAQAFNCMTNMKLCSMFCMLYNCTFLWMLKTYNNCAWFMFFVYIHLYSLYIIKLFIFIIKCSTVTTVAQVSLIFYLIWKLQSIVDWKLICYFFIAYVTYFMFVKCRPRFPWLASAVCGIWNSSCLCGLYMSIWDDTWRKCIEHRFSEHELYVLCRQ